MSLNSLLNQPASIAWHDGRDLHGKAIQGESQDIVCRFEQVKKTIVNKQGETEPVDGLVFVANDTIVTAGDKFTFENIDYRVLMVAPIIDGRGQTRHIELKVQLWRA